MIDPIGLAFEHFDGVGRWRDTEGPHTIDATGEIVSSPSTDGAFDGLAELQAHLAGSPDVQACSAELPHFGSGRGQDGELGAPDVGPGSLPVIDDDTVFSNDDGGGPGGTPGLSVAMTVDDWGTGYCANVEVTNDGAEAVVLPFDGTINNMWSAAMTNLGGGQYSFVGLEWNAALAGGAMNGFGLCGAR